MSKRTSFRYLEILVRVERLSKNSGQRDTAKSFLDYYYRNGRFPENINSTILRFVDTDPDLFPEKRRELNKQKFESEFYLYAISNGESVKIGYSSNVENRLKQLQTAQDKPLKCVWSILCGVNEKTAGREESRLHKRLKKFLIKGEWYDARCLPIVFSHNIKRPELSEIHKKRRETEKTKLAEERLDKELITRLRWV